MTQISPLSPDRLVRRCDTDSFTFTTSAELDDLTGSVGQVRAIDVAHFSIDIRHAGLSLYVMREPTLPPVARLARQEAWNRCWTRSNARLY